MKDHKVTVFLEREIYFSILKIKDHTFEAEIVIEFNAG